MEENIILTEEESKPSNFIHDFIDEDKRGSLQQSSDPFSPRA